MPRSKAVDAWFARYENPMKDVVQRMREIILAADPRIEECIKWQAPTFVFEGIPGDHPRLEGTGDTSRVMKIGSVAEANAARRDLERIVKAWCAWRAESPAKKKPAAKKKTGARR
jgi:uncharacterized protein DUF1801